MESWEGWQIMLVMGLMSVKYFILGSIWGSMRARHRVAQAIRNLKHEG